jgi:Tfp pilus assembly protein PilO
MSALTMNVSARSIWLPLDEWSARRTLLSALLLAFAVFFIGMQTWRASGLIDLEASRSALDEAHAKVGQARRLSANLPDLRARAKAGDLNPPSWTAADALRAITELATQSGLRVMEIEPIQPNATDRALKFRADGAFPDIVRFLQALSGLPRLIVPERTQIRPQAGVLGIEAALRVYEALPAVPMPEPARTDAFVIDPFGKESAGGFARGSDLMLVGTFVGGHRAMALVQSGEDVDGFVAGQRIGDERIGRVAPRSIQLAGDDGLSRTLTIAGERGDGSFERVAAQEIPHVAAELKPRAKKAAAPPKRKLASTRDKPASSTEGIPRHSIFDKARQK